MVNLTDKYGRLHDYLRISLTDRCNLNCIYCNPEYQNFEKLQREDILNYDELIRLVKIFLNYFRIKKIRFTGGEPLERRGVLDFFEMLSRVKRKNNFEFCLTTNGTLLEGSISRLKDLGLNKLNISLDSLNPERYKYITGSDSANSAINSILKAEELKFDELKINVVVIRGINDDEILDFIDFFKDMQTYVRFIEYMPFKNNSWNKNAFLNCSEIKEIIERKYILIEINDNRNQVTRNYNIEGYKGRVGFISPISNHFCGRCNRLRIQSGGSLKLCLFSNGLDDINLKKYIRDMKYNDELIAKMVFDKLQSKEKEHASIDELKTQKENNMISIGG
ncbi:MAG: GTP 3',8-cyclase MoaA [Ignavibacteria bacterium]|nr:GTP 3',8-cyclase MoaA [Ignavibacteria bacterium]